MTSVNGDSWSQQDKDELVKLVDNAKTIQIGCQLAANISARTAGACYQAYRRCKGYIPKKKEIAVVPPQAVIEAPNEVPIKLRIEVEIVVKTTQALQQVLV